MNRHPVRRRWSTALVCLGAALGLTACGGGASSDPGSASAPASSIASTPSSEPASAPPSAAPSSAPAGTTISVAAKGQNSPECSATSTVLMHATTIGAKANSGSVTQADVDRAFGADAVAGVPADVMVYVAATKAIAVQLPGKDAAAAGALLGPWMSAFGDLSAAAQKVCS